MYLAMEIPASLKGDQVEPTSAPTKTSLSLRSIQLTMRTPAWGTHAEAASGLLARKGMWGWRGGKGDLLSIISLHQGATSLEDKQILTIKCDSCCEEVYIEYFKSTQMMSSRWWWRRIRTHLLQKKAQENNNYIWNSSLGKGPEI